MRIIELVMAGLFLLMGYQLAVNCRWTQALGVIAGSAILASPVKPQIKIPVMLIVITMIEVTLKN